jgi:hypothetical protein
VKLSAPASVTARTSSGDVNVIVPAGRYQVKGAPTLEGLTADSAATNVIDVSASSGDAYVVAQPAA